MGPRQFIIKSVRNNVDSSLTMHFKFPSTLLTKLVKESEGIFFYVNKGTQFLCKQPVITAYVSDISFAGGKFVYAMKSGIQATKSRLISGQVCGPQCVEFFYFMEKFKKSEFRLSTWKDGKGDRIWFDSGRGKQSKDWTRSLVEINAENDSCFVVCKMTE